MTVFQKPCKTIGQTKVLLFEGLPKDVAGLKKKNPSGCLGIMENHWKPWFSNGKPWFLSSAEKKHLEITVIQKPLKTIGKYWFPCTFFKRVRAHRFKGCIKTFVFPRSLERVQEKKQALICCCRQHELITRDVIWSGLTRAAADGVRMTRPIR